MVESPCDNSHTDPTDGAPVNTPQDKQDIPSDDDQLQQANADAPSSSTHRAIKRKLNDIDGRVPEKETHPNSTDLAKSDTATTSSVPISNANESSNNDIINLDMNPSQQNKQSTIRNINKVPPPTKQKIDIYGRVPPKEPKYPISCPTCNRSISVSRFAAHLEKCMGISGRNLGGPSKYSG